MRVLFDTSVLVAATVAELKNHEAAFDCFARYSSGRHQGFCSAHTLAESYATLTALPLKRRIQPTDAQRLIDETLCARLTILELPGAAYRDSIKRVSSIGLISGVIYDALHLTCAESHDCKRLYTYNVSYFKKLNPQNVQISAP